MKSNFSLPQQIASLSDDGVYPMLVRSQELEAQGREIIHMEIGQPDFDTHDTITMAGIRAITTGKTRYTSPTGIVPLRKAIAQSAGLHRSVRFNWEQVLIAPGAKPLILLPLMAVVQPGDEIIYPDPGFPTYEAAIHIVGGKPIGVPLSEEKSYDLDLEFLESVANPQTRMIIINSPSNPTGGVLSQDTLIKIARIARRYDCWILSDEVYSKLVYDESASSIASLPGMAERTILVDGFSKTYAMTGWRLGYGILPRSLVRKVELLLSNTIGCTAEFTQYAGMQAISGLQYFVEEMRAEFQRRRDVMISGLNAIPGVQCVNPCGAFYAFPNIKTFKLPAEELSNYLLEEAGVATIPGTVFGNYGKDHIRLSYATSMENINKALERLREALGKLR